MSKPDWCPEDVRDAAQSVYFDLQAVNLYNPEESLSDREEQEDIEDIARAILAERERCAVIAQEAANEADGGEYYIASKIATIIRGTA